MTDPLGPTSGSYRVFRGGGRAGRVDYKEILSDADFAVFARLRDVRKRLAAEESIPVFAVCTNEQMAEMARRRVSTLAAIKEIEGIGDAKASWPPTTTRKP